MPFSDSGKSDVMLKRIHSEAEELIFGIIGKEDIQFQEPRGEYGDFATNICFSIAGKFKKSPQKIAQEIVEKITLPEGSLISRIESQNGFINFFINYNKATGLLIEEIKEKGADFGRGYSKGKIILEHTSANPDGPLHIGHGRNAIIGDSLARVMSFAGYDVERQYYLNDMGKQLAVVVYGLERFPIDKQKKNDHAIAEIYIKANKLYEESDEVKDKVSKLMIDYEAEKDEVVRKFEYAARFCLEGINETLSKLYIKHDTITWESQFVRSGLVNKVLSELEAIEYVKNDEKAIYLDLKEFGIEKELVLRRSDGTLLYATRDLAHHLWKSSRGRVIDIWGADHKLLARQISVALELLGAPEPEFVIYEFITLPEGSMSTRRGVFISVDELIKESINRAYEEVNKRRPDESEEFKHRVAEKVGIGALRFNIVRIAPEKSMTFRWEEALDFDRLGAPSIQYAYARARRILEQSEPEENFEVPELNEYEKALVKEIMKFPFIVENSALSRKPNIFANYLAGLTDSFHKFYMFTPVLKSEFKNFRLNLVLAFTLVIKKGLELLGIEAPERM